MGIVTTFSSGAGCVSVTSFDFWGDEYFDGDDIEPRALPDGLFADNDAVDSVGGHPSFVSVVEAVLSCEENFFSLCVASSV